MRVIIAGGGIGGLAAALALHARGIDAVVFERSATIRELGVGINTLPHAIGVLAELGLLPALDAVALRTHELIYANRHGQTVWRELRGIDAGHAGAAILHPSRPGCRACCWRPWISACPAPVRCGHALESFVDDGAGVTARFRLADGSVAEERGGRAGGGGRHPFRGARPGSIPRKGRPLWNGIMLWRGAVPWAPFLTGRSMIIAGGMDGKLVLYPIATRARRTSFAELGDYGPGGAGRHDPAAAGGLEPRGLAGRVDAARRGVPRVRTGRLGGRARHARNSTSIPCATAIPWIGGPGAGVTLLGDAAHPMYPVGSNGASQAILDAQALAAHLAVGAHAVAALAAYEAERAPATAAIVRSNRLGGPERVIDLIDSRAPDGFARLEDIASEAELRAVVGGYASMAGFSAKVAS